MTVLKRKAITIQCPGIALTLLSPPPAPLSGADGASQVVPEMALRSAGSRAGGETSSAPAFALHTIGHLPE